MINRTITASRIKLSLFSALLGFALLGLAGCSIPGLGPAIGPREAPTVLLVESPVAPAQMTPTPTSLVSATEPGVVPTESPTAPPVEPSVTPPPTETPAWPEVRLPATDVEDLRRVAEANHLEFVSLAVENTVIYALPPAEGGTVFLLTPLAKPAGFSTKELAANPAMFANRMLGGLTVVRQVNDELPALPPDDYVITLATDARQVIFTGANGTFRFNAVIRALPQRLPRPVALITASQMCLAWDATQICALAKSPLPPNWVERLRGAIQPPAREADFVLDQAVPDVEGINALNRCGAALNQTTTPDYAGCWATVLAAPAVRDGAFPPPTPPSQGQETGIGLLVVLELIREDVFYDPELTQPVPVDPYGVGNLPPGDFLVYEVRLKGDPPAQLVGDLRRDDNRILKTRVRLFREAGDFYLPSISGAMIVGIPVRGIGLTAQDKAVIANLWIAWRCFFKWRQCPWYP